jgi:hypothetical protein
MQAGTTEKERKREGEREREREKEGHGFWSLASRCFKKNNGLLWEPLCTNPHSKTIWNPHTTPKLS